MKALFISTHFPRDFRQGATGSFKRMRTFLDALKDKATIRLLFYYRPEMEPDAERIADAKSILKSEWQLGDFDLVLCRQHSEPWTGDRLWDGYLVRTLSMHRQIGYVATSGAAQVHAFDECLEDRPDIVFAHRLNTICPALMTKRPLPPVFMDLDDVEHKILLREATQPPRWLSKRLLCYLQFPALLLGERQAIKLSRKTFVCSDLDARYLARRWGLSNVHVIPNSIRIPEAQPLGKQPVLLFIGAYGYMPNVVAADYLISRIWPLIREACPEARLIVAGAGPERIPCFTRHHPGVEYPGFVEDLDALYRRARVVCCPIQTGGGTRIKVIEAAAYGKPVVSTHIGAEGLEFCDESEILLRDNPPAFAAACVELFKNDELCITISRAARDKAVERYDRQSVIRLIQKEVFG